MTCVAARQTSSASGLVHATLDDLAIRLYVFTDDHLGDAPGRSLPPRINKADAAVSNANPRATLLLPQSRRHAAP